MKKRTLALVCLALLVALGAGTLFGLRTRFAGDRICGLVAGRVRAATGLALAFDACRFDPIGLEVEVGGVRLGERDAPLFAAEALHARLAPLQALGGRLQIASVRAVRPRLAVTLPEGGGDAGGGACPRGALERVEVQRLEIEEGSVDVTLPAGRRVTVARLDVRTAPAPPRTLRDLASPLRRARVEVALEGARLDGLDSQPIGVARGRVELDVALDLSDAEVDLAADVDGVRLGAAGRVTDLCAPDLALDAEVEGSVAAVLRLARLARDPDADGTVGAKARVTGPLAAPDVRGTIRVDDARIAWFRAGDLRAEARLDGASLAVDRAVWPYGGGQVVARGTVGLRHPVALDAEAELKGVDLAEILERVGIAGSWVTVKLDGKGRVGGTLAPIALDGTLAADFRDLRALTRSWRAAPRSERGVVEVKRGRVEAGLRVTDDALSFDAARVSAGRGASEVDAVVRFDASEGFSVRTRGEVDLDAMGSIAGVPWSGLAQVDGTIEAAPYGNPRVLARATRVQGFRFLELDLGDVTADVSYGPDFVLRIREGQGVKGQSRYRGEMDVDLEASPPAVLSSRLEAKGRIRDLLEAIRDYLPSTRRLHGHVDGEVELSGSAWGPAGRLDGTFEGRFGRGTLLGRAFDSGRAAGTFHRGAEARLERAELRRGPGVARARGRWEFADPIPWDLQLELAGLPVAALELPGGGWEGSASGSAVLAGSFDHPDVRFDAIADAVSVGGTPLGSVQIGGTIVERTLLATATSDVARVEGEASLEGRLPFTARASLALEDVARLVPGGAGGLRARVRGEAAAEGELEELAEARGHLRLDVVEAAHGDVRVESVRPVVITFGRGTVELQDLVLRGPSTELALAGSRSSAGELDVAAAGTVDLRLLAGLAPELRRPHGLLTVEAHVTGTAAQPVLVGAGRLEGAGAQLKAANVLLSGVRGELAFSQNRVLFDALTASVNGGRAALAGEVELASFSPTRVRLEAKLDEVPFAVPAHLPVALSGRLEAAGTPAFATVTGRLHVVRARYTANVDLEKNLLGGARRPAPPPRPYDRAGEGIRLDVQLVVDGDARVENDLVSGDVRGDLALTGTLAAPGLVGSLSMAEGSRARFRGNEFALSHAVLDFVDRNRVEIAIDVHGESRVRDYQIFMHAFGPLADPQLTLTSAPALSQPDIITLLSLGFTRRDAAAGGGVQGVATAAAAQALFSASGLDEQVKRFLPRGGMVRDVSVRITSEWSEVTGQVEPRAEFESFLLRDRLRLRYQAPLSAARGQRAQAELRLGHRTAVQYQWENDNPDVARSVARGTGDHGVDLKLRWEWVDE